MVELNLGPPPSRGPGKAIGIAAAAMVAIAVAAYFLTPRGVAKITVTHESLVAPHIETKSMGGGLTVVGAGSSEDALYAAEDLHIKNERGQPLFLTGATATVTLADGTEEDATVVTPHDYPRIEPSFPALTPLLSHPLALDGSVPANGSLDGTVLLLFPNQTEVAWKAKRGGKLTLLLAHGEPQTVTLP